MAVTEADPALELMGYTIAQAAAVLGLDRDRVARLVRAGVLPHIKVGARWLIGKRALEEWLTQACLANVRHQLGGQNDPVPLIPRKYVRRGSPNGREVGTR